MSVNNKCGACGVLGHNVRGCMDVGAGCVLAELMCETELLYALVQCRRMSLRHVSFALCHGFDVAVSGGRKKLLSCITERLSVRVLGAVVVLPLLRHMPRAELLQMSQANTSALLYYNAQAQARNDTFLDVSLLVSHPRYGEEMSAEEANNFKQSECIQTANSALNVITDDVHRTRTITFDLDLNQYLNDYVASDAVLCALIATASYDLHLSLTPVATQYIVSLIRRQNCKRERSYINRELQAYEPKPAPEVMKTLKTTITCRAPHRSKKTDMLVSCGICFDDFKPTMLVKTGCGHDFCTGCISGWAKQRGIKSFIQCPCCRAEIDTLTVGTKTELKKMTTGLAPCKLLHF